MSFPVITVALYYQTLTAPFIFDDRTSVTRNWAIQLFSYWRVMRTSTRPLTSLSYALTFQLSRLSPWGYHLGNIILHAINGLLVYAVIRLILRLPRFERQYGDSHWAVWTVSLLFLVHPLQTEVVAYISSRSDALAALFVLAATVCLALAVRWGSARRWSAGARAGAAVCVLLGVMSKESAAVAPLLLFLLDWAAAGGRAGRVLRRHWVFYGILGAGWVVPVWVVLRHPEYAQTAGFGFAGVTPRQYLYTQVGVIVHYLRLTLIPYGQVVDYEWPLAARLFEPHVLIPGGLLLAALAAALRSWHRRPLHSLCVLWFFINLAPTSSFMPIADVIAERRMYLPILGVLGLMALWVTAVWRRWVAGRQQSVRRLTGAVVGVVVVAAVGCGVLTWQRNLLWRDPLLLWQEDARRSPGNPRVHANLGTLYARRGQPQRARAELERAARLIAAGRSRHAAPPLPGFVYTHLSSVYVTLRDLPRARTAYKLALAHGAWRERFLRKRLRWVYKALGPGVPAPG
ncbi:MAG: tetratricopeptide repeat protein [Candidatus Binatia bacterium]